MLYVYFLPFMLYVYSIPNNVVFLSVQLCHVFISLPPPPPTSSSCMSFAHPLLRIIVSERNLWSIGVWSRGFGIQNIYSDTASRPPWKQWVYSRTFCRHPLGQDSLSCRGVDVPEMRYSSHVRGWSFCVLATENYLATFSGVVTK